MSETTVRGHHDQRWSTSGVAARVTEQAEQLVAQWRGGLSGKATESPACNVLDDLSDQCNGDVHRRQLQRLSDLSLLLGHEMRCSLNSILISAEVLARPELRSDTELCDKQLDGIRSAVAHAEELLAYASAVIGAPATPPELRMAPLQTVLEAVSDELESRARASRVKLIFQKSLPRWSVDSMVARLTLCNLLVNAIKYADAAKPDRWVIVRVGPAEGEDSASLMMEVADNGLGIPAKFQQRVFLRSFRAHPQVAQGAGLGLAITRECLVDHGGSIQLISEEGVGTTVRVWLPAVPMNIADPAR